jgi:uncharacterized membrane protein
MKLARQGWLKLSGWSIPLGYAAAALIAGMTLPRLEHHFLPALVSTMSPSSAMAICSTIAGGMISLTGIVFSLTFVMVQFSAMAYSPRLVLWVARDPVMSHALAVFSATFLYALGMLGWVDREGLGKVPFVSSWLVLALLLASIAMFIALIERSGLLQVNRMLIFTGDQGRKAIAELYPAGTPAAPAAESADLGGGACDSDRHSHRTPADHPGRAHGAVGRTGRGRWRGHRSAGRRGRHAGGDDAAAAGARGVPTVG